MNKELMERLLEVSKHAAREVESAVSGVKDPHLRGVIAGVIMQRILEAVDDHPTHPVVREGASASSDSGAQIRKGGTQARIMELRSDSFFRDPRRLEEVLEELRVRGYHHNKS
ncbi:MAG: hypothetical protein WCH75_31270, partial [Candidatus Binatia bacterium]